jgi:hypothetical protein
MMGLKQQTPPKPQYRNLIQCSLRLLLLPIFKTTLIWESIQTVKSLNIHSHNNIQMFIEAIPVFMKEEMENVRSSSTELNICTTAIFANLKNLGKECQKI